jgi:glucan phosphorylase
VKWRELPAEWKLSMEKLLITRMKKINSREISAILKGSVGMEYRWFDNIQIQENLFERIHKIFERDQIDVDDDKSELADIIYAIAKGGIKKNDLPEKLLQVFLQRFVEYKSSFEAPDVFHMING